MSYDGKALARARAQYDSDKSKREAAFRARRDEILAASPRLQEIEAKLRGTVSRVMAEALRHGDDPKAAVLALRGENEALQRERAEILVKMGFEADALTLKPACGICGDRGFDKDGAVCGCLKKYYVTEQNRELSKLLNIGAQSFDAFRMDLYSRDRWSEYGMSPAENMELIRETCWRYARSFGPNSGSLFLTGTPGLGKTFLSACIAREVSQNGFSVVYDTATHVFSQFEVNKFRRGTEDEQEEAAADVRRYLACDLLIVDDLGTELVTPFVQDVLYQLVNNRIVAEKKTIISSNLTEAEVRRRYSPQIASRLSGEYRMMTFFGEDIRKIKQRRGL